MNTQTVETNKTSNAVVAAANTKPAVKAEAPKTAPVKAEKPAEPVIKDTPVDERRYDLLDRKSEPAKFRGKQRQIVYNILRESTEPMTIAQVVPLATKAGLTATGGVAPSVKYHLHHLTKDLVTKVVNPRITIE